jgi:hypothetical protein
MQFFNVFEGRKNKTIFFCHKRLALSLFFCPVVYFLLTFETLLMQAGEKFEHFKCLDTNVVAVSRV